MALEAVEERLKAFYKLNIGKSSVNDLENALKEMAQEIALRALALSGFFREGVFQGGSCLRIVHKMQRFSEDLDFTLREPRPGYDNAVYMNAVKDELTAFGFSSDVIDKGKADKAVAKTFVRMRSVGSILNIETGVSRRKNIRIKIEVDTNPPDGQKTAHDTILWPSAFPIVLQDVPTLFAGKLHALLCREYEKGRDWYDLAWYVQRGAGINYVYLRNALLQSADIDESSNIDAVFVRERLKERLGSQNFQKIKGDVRPLVKDAREIELWTKEMFFKIIDDIREN